MPKKKSKKKKQTKKIKNKSKPQKLMTTFCYDIQNEVDFTKFLQPFNSVVRFAYNRFRDEIEAVEKIITKMKAAEESKKKLKTKEKIEAVEYPEPQLKIDDVVRLAQSKLKNIEVLDFSLLRYAVLKADSMKHIPKVIFGSRKLFKALKYFHLKKNPITPLEDVRENFKNKKNTRPLFLRGCCSDSHGNRKAQLDIIDNNSVVIKLSRKSHITVKLPKLSKQHLEQLTKLQDLCEKKQACFSIEVNNSSISIITDPFYIKLDKKQDYTENRVLALDLNPNYTGVSIIDWDNGTKTIVYKEIVDITAINELPDNSIPKIKYKKNKRDFETSEVNRHLIDLALNYRCELIAFEDLDIESKDLSKGKKLNKLINNCWNRTKMVQNLMKRCVINNIKYQSVVAAYSSFIGQLQHENEYDSIAASFEISRRAFLIDSAIKENREIRDIIYPGFDIQTIPTRWKKMVLDKNIKTWKKLYDSLKKFKSCYRFLFVPKKFGGVSLRLKSYKSGVMIRFV